MAKQTDNRVNKLFLTPDDSQPAIDPGASDVIQEDRRYDAIEDHRVRAAEDRRYDAIEEHRAGAGGEGSQAEDRSYDAIEEHRAKLAGDIEDSPEKRWEAEHPQPTDTVDTSIDNGPQDIQAEPFRPV